MTIHRILVSSVYLALCAPFIAAAAVPGGDQEDVAFLFKGMEDNLGRLRSGTFNGSGTKEVYKGDKKTSEHSIEIYSAFDYRKDLFRFDQTERVVYPKVLVVDERSQPTPPKGFEGKEASFKPNTRRVFGGKYARNEKNSFSYLMDSRDAIIDKSDVKSSRLIEDFDVRVLPFAYYVDLIRHTPYESLFKSWSSRTPYSVTKENDHVYRLEHVKGVRQAIWIDTSKGFEITRMEESYAQRNAPKGTAWQEPWIAKQLDWQLIGDVWVPSKFHLKMVVDPGKEGEHTIVVLSFNFTWKSVNADTEVKNYSLEGFNLKDGTYVVNRTLGPPIVERVVGSSSKPDFVVVPPNDNEAHVAQADHRPNYLGVLLINILAVLGISIILLVNRRKRRRKSESQ